MDRAAKTNDDIAFMRLDRELNAPGDRGGAQRLCGPRHEAAAGAVAPLLVHALPEAADLPLCARLHASQARAVAKGDGDAAARASDKLMDYVENFTRATVSVLKAS